MKNGSQAPWAVRPYATWTLSDIGGGMDMVGGATYDPATGRIYVSQKFGDGDLPLIHVYTIQ